MRQFSWIIVVLVAACSAHITMANPQHQGNSTAEYIPAPTLFRSVFAGRPVPGYPKDYSVPAKEKEPEEENLLKEASEENNVEDESEESDEDDKSNESRIKKNASSDESESDEDDSDEDESDEDESDEDDSDEDKDEKKSSSEAGNTKPSRWRQTRYGSSFRIQAVGRPINYAHHGYGNQKMDTPKY